MNNLQHIVKAAACKKPNEFEYYVHKELSSRIADKFQEKRTEIAQKLFDEDINEKKF